MHRIAFWPCLGLIVALGAVAPVRADDAFTGVPVAPGVRDSAPVHGSAVCAGSNHLRLSVFTWPTGTPASSIAAWYERTLPGAGSQQTMHVKGVTEYVVSNATSRILVFDEAGDTLLRILHAERPVDFDHVSKTCTEIS